LHDFFLGFSFLLCEFLLALTGLALARRLSFGRRVGSGGGRGDRWYGGRWDNVVVVDELVLLVFLVEFIVV
jgi:hypothetical protein